MNENSDYFTQIQEWCCLLWSGIMWVMNPVDRYTDISYNMNTNWCNLMNEHTILLLFDAFVVLSFETSRGFSAVFFFLVKKCITQSGQCPFLKMLLCFVHYPPVGIEQILRINLDGWLQYSDCLDKCNASSCLHHITFHTLPSS